jgi:hypothetical protein
MQRRGTEGRMPVGAPSHEQPATQSGRAEGTSYRGRQPDQQVDQSAGDASNESAKIGGERRLEVESRSMPCAGGPEAAAQQVRRGGQLQSSEECGRSR